MNIPDAFNFSNITKNLPQIGIDNALHPIESRLQPECFCIFLNYDLWIALNIFFSGFYIINTMFEPFRGGPFKEMKINTQDFNFYSMIMMFTINIYFFLIHFLLEPLAYFMGYA